MFEANIRCDVTCNGAGVLTHIQPFYKYINPSPTFGCGDVTEPNLRRLVAVHVRPSFVSATG